MFTDLVSSLTITIAGCFNSSFITVYSERLADDLWVAVHDGSISRVKTLLQQGANPSHPLYWRKEWWNQQYGTWPWRTPPFNTACQEGNLEIVKLLVKAGANVDEGNGNTNNTPLNAACEGGHKKVVVYLIKEAGCKTGEFIL